MSYCSGCAALQRQLDSLLASRASRSGDTPKAKKAIALPRRGHRLAILRALDRNGARSVDSFDSGKVYGKCPWKRMSELRQMGLVTQTASVGWYRLTAEGEAHVRSLEVLR